MRWKKRRLMYHMEALERALVIVRTRILLAHRYGRPWGKQRRSWNRIAHGMLQRPFRSGCSWPMRWRCSTTTSRSKMPRSSCWWPRRGWACPPAALFSPPCPTPSLALFPPLCLSISLCWTKRHPGVGLCFFSWCTVSNNVLRLLEKGAGLLPPAFWERRSGGR